MERLLFEKIFQEVGLHDFKWLNPKEIVVANWVRMKCMFGCPEYGNSTCLPNASSIQECRDFFREYDTAVVFHFQIQADKDHYPEQWSKKIYRTLVSMEEKIFQMNYPKAFLLAMSSCELCKECATDRKSCKNPKKARPNPEALCVDVYSTVKKIGYPIQVLYKPCAEMNRYGFLLVE